MTPEAYLLFLLAAIYLSDCLLWAREDEYVFTRSGSRWSWQRGPTMKLGPSRGWTLLEPWPPLGPGMATAPSGLLNAKAFEMRVAAWQDATRALVIPAHALFTAVLVLVPLATAFDAWPRAWPIVLASVVVPWLIVLALSLRACRRLQPDGPRLSSLAPLLLSPIASIRARDYLAAEVSRGFHPVAVARVLCAREQFIALARWHYHDPDSDQTQLAAFLARDGALPDVLAPPSPDDERTVSFCPRCLSQYQADVERCAECGAAPSRFTG